MTQSKKKTQEYRDYAVDELDNICSDLRKEIFQLKNEKKIARKLDQPHKIKENRRNIARVLTLINEKRSKEL